VIIRDAALADALAICQVRVETWRTAYGGMVPAEHLAGMSAERTVPMWQEILQRPRPPYFIFVAQAPGGTTVGFAAGGPERTNDTDFRGEVAGLYVLQPYQRRGIGRRLLASAASALLDASIESMLIWTLAENPNRPFCEKLGGQYVREHTVQVGGGDVRGVAYGWRDIYPLLRVGAVTQ